MLFRLKMKVTLVDFDVLFYKWFLMILGGIIAVGSFVFMILMVLAGIWIGAALMLFCSLMGAGTFYTGWDTGRNRPEEQEPEDQETTDVEHRQES